MPQASEVTDEQFIEAIKRLHAKNNYAPTYKELAEAIGYAIKTVHNRVYYLESKGILKTAPGRGAASARTLRVVGHDCSRCGGSGYSGV